MINQSNLNLVSSRHKADLFCSFGNVGRSFEKVLCVGVVWVVGGGGVGVHGEQGGIQALQGRIPVLNSYTKH